MKPLDRLLGIVVWMAGGKLLTNDALAKLPILEDCTEEMPKADDQLLAGLIID